MCLNALRLCVSYVEGYGVHLLIFRVTLALSIVYAHLQDKTALPCEEGESVHSLWFVGNDGGEPQV